MNYLFVDASQSLTVGLLNESWEWIKFKQLDQLPSIALHQVLLSFLPDNKWSGIAGVFFCKGPGSYTGLRLIEGLEQYLKFEGVRCHDFYSFELRGLLNIDEAFLYSAFKGQYLLSQKDNKLLDKELIDKSLDYYGEKLGSDFNFKSIINLIESSAKDIFPRLIDSESKEIYYFRPLSEEFKK